MVTGALNIGEYCREQAEGHSKHHVYIDGIYRAVATSLAGAVLAGPLFLKTKMKLHFTKSK